MNPNSAWSYGFTTSVGEPFTLDTISGSTFFSGEVGWFGPIPDCCAPGYPLVTVQPGVIPDVLDMGPGPSSYAVVRWTAPTRGRWDVVGQFVGTGLTTGDVHVLRNGAPVFDSPVNELLQIRLIVLDKRRGFGRAQVISVFDASALDSGEGAKL